MTTEERSAIEARIIDVLKTVYDPEIPVNIYDLGLIYKIEVKEDATVDLDMTFTAPACPAADFILEDVRQKIESIEHVAAVNVELVFEPAWDHRMMSEEARVELKPVQTVHKGEHFSVKMEKIRPSDKLYKLVSTKELLEFKGLA